MNTNSTFSNEVEEKLITRPQQKKCMEDRFFFNLNIRTTRKLRY